MKTLALTVLATALVAGVSAPAVAADHGNQQLIDTQIVSVSGDTAVLANGFSVDAPRAAAAGDKVRLVMSENNELKTVIVLSR